MLHVLGKSKIRKRIMMLFLYNQSESYYIRQVARLVSTSAGTAQRELRVLEAQDLLLRSTYGNQVVYSLNSKNPLLPEIEKIVASTIGIEYAMREALHGLHGIEFAFIFGSYAKDEFRVRSDVDLFVIGTVSEDMLHAQCIGVERIIQHEINYHIVSMDTFKREYQGSIFFKDITQQYILVYGDESRFKDIVAKVSN